MSGIAALIIVLVTLFVPPIGVLAVAGCSMGKPMLPLSNSQLLTISSLDFIVNILLTILGFLPGLIHGLYVLYVYYDRRDQLAQGRPLTSRAPGVYSDKVQNPSGYGTM